MAAAGLTFADVPPGTGDVAALGLRGGDHDVECVNTHAYFLTLGDAHRLADATAANRTRKGVRGAGMSNNDTCKQRQVSKDTEL